MGLHAGLRQPPNPPIAYNLRVSALATSPPGGRRENSLRVGGLAPTVAICSALVLGATLAFIAFARLSLPGQALAAPFPDQHQDAENASFAFAFVIALPLGILAGRRLADRIARGPAATSLNAAALLCAGSLFACVVMLRVVAHFSLGHVLSVQLALMIVWLAAALAGLASLASSVPRAGWLGGDRDRALLVLALLAGAAATLAVVDLHSVALVPLLVGLVLLAGVDRLAKHRSGGSYGGPWLDLAFIVVVFLAIPNLAIFDSANPFLDQILQFHQNFFIGPAERVLGGDPVLAGTVSQYGVGSIFLVAGWFHLAPVNNYTLGLLEGLLSAAMFASAYGALRLAGVRRSVAVTVIVVGLMACVFALQYPLGGLLQHGAIRFGLPAGVVFGAVVAERSAGRRRAGLAIQLATLAIASIWALEAFAYTLFTLLAIVAVQAALLPRESRRPWLVRRAGMIATAIAGAHLAFALAMLAGTGELPDWGAYLTTLREFLTGKVGDLTYDFEPFSPALAVGGAYLVSAVGIVVVVGRSAAAAPLAQPVKLMALTGATAWGIALFSYFVNRSAGHILPYICLPALMTGALWLSILIDSQPDPRAPGRRIALALGGSLAALVVAVAFGTGISRFSDSALALAAPGGESLTNALRRAWDPPPIAAGAEQGERLLERYMPGEDESLILTSADLGVEVLARTGRINTLPFSDPWEDSFVPSNHIGPLREAIAGLRPFSGHRCSSS